MDREAIARGRRREQIREALDFERDREAALGRQLAELIVETDGPRVDESVFSSMEPGDVALVRELLAEPSVDEPEWEGEDGRDLFELYEGSPEDEAQESAEEEIARLEQELDLCRRRQRAYERYLAALEP